MRAVEKRSHDGVPNRAGPYKTARGRQGKQAARFEVRGLRFEV